LQNLLTPLWPPDLNLKKSSHPITLPAIGVDVGFFSTKFSIGRHGNRGGDIEVRQFPSLAPRISTALKEVSAKDGLQGVLIEVEEGVRHFVGKDVFHLIGTSNSRAVTPDYCLTADYRALFLGALFHIAREHEADSDLLIKVLIAGLPLSTVYTHSKGLEVFIKGPHTIPNPADPSRTIRVTVERPMVIAQPQGALIAHGIGNGPAVPGDFNTLVLDMGGGTFDWFVAKGVKPNRALCGATSIGALACAAAICDEIKPGLKDNPDIMARVDRALRDEDEFVTVTGIKYEMRKFEPIIHRVLDDAIEQMRKSVGSLDSMDKILVTGGGARMLKKALDVALPEYSRLIHVDDEPVASNVRGFHALAEYQSERR